MGGAFDQKMLQQQQQEQQQQASRSGQAYNSDGSGKANDYRPPPLPRSDFPPQTAGAPGKDLVVDRDRLRQVATQMAADLAKLRTTLQRLQSEGAGGGLIGGWPTADGLGNNAINAFEGISAFYGDLNTAYDAVIANIHRTVNNYADAESDTASAAHGVGSHGTPGSLTPGH